MSRPVYELRTYVVNPGRLAELVDRFRIHSLPLFAKHGLGSVAYWTAKRGDDDLLIYLLSHPSRDAAQKNWAAFQADQAWVQAKTASEVNGKLVTSIDSVLMDATDFSPLR